MDLRPSENRTATPTLGLCSYFPEEIVGLCKTSNGHPDFLSFLLCLTMMLQQSTLTPWIHLPWVCLACRFGLASLDLSYSHRDGTWRTFPNRRGCIGPFPKVAWRDWTCLAPFGLASLHRSQRCLSPFTWVPWDSFPEQVFLDPGHRVFREL